MLFGADDSKLLQDTPTSIDDVFPTSMKVIEIIWPTTNYFKFLDQFLNYRELHCLRDIIAHSASDRFGLGLQFIDRIPQNSMVEQ
jgi:hypothetical protein